MPEEESKPTPGFVANLPRILKQLTALVGAVGTITAGYFAYKASTNNPSTAAPTAVVTAHLTTGTPAPSTPSPTTAAITDAAALPYDGEESEWCFFHQPMSSHLHCRPNPEMCLEAAASFCASGAIRIFSKGKGVPITAVSDCEPPEALVAARDAAVYEGFVSCF